MDGRIGITRIAHATGSYCLGAKATPLNLVVIEKVTDINRTGFVTCAIAPSTSKVLTSGSTSRLLAASSMSSLSVAEHIQSCCSCFYVMLRMRRPGQ
jgi:hypothetical protein